MWIYQVRYTCYLCSKSLFFFSIDSSEARKKYVSARHANNKLYTWQNAFFY